MGCGGSAPADHGSSKGGSAADSKTGPKAEAQPQSLPAGAFGAGSFVVDSTGKITESYDLDKRKLGEGSYGAVHKAKHKKSGNIRAVKAISKSQMKNIDRFKQEIEIMKVLDHPNIIKLFETYEDARNIYLVMELCSGGELFDRIIESGHFTEVQAAVLMQQIMRAIYYMHESHVCHRDLKPENFLFQNKDSIEQSLLKIIDFGLSCKFKEGDNEADMLKTKAGTPYYVAPQVLAGKYKESSDIWSCGVIMYVVLCGYPPFFGETDAEVLSKVRLGNFSFNAADWKNISEDAKNLIRKMLKMNPKDRYTADQALNDVWIKNKAPSAKNIALESHFVDNLRHFRSHNKLKKAALHIIAGQLSDEKIKALRETFVALDVNGDGLLTTPELKEGLTKAGLTEIPPDLQQIMEDVDCNGSGEIDYTEFLAATLDKRKHLQEDALWNAFRIFDRNGDGKISQSELTTVLGDDGVKEKFAGETIAAILKDTDTNGDGEIDFEEFTAMMQKQDIM